MNRVAGKSLVSPMASKVAALLLADLPAAGGGEAWEALARGDPGFLEGLRREGLTPLLYREVVRQGREGNLDPAIRRQLRQDYASSLKAAARQEREILPVLQALKEAGVEVILLKGADLRLRLYGDPAPRPMVDLDLLVDKAQLRPAQDVLARLGYRVSPLCADPRPGFRDRFENELIFESASGRALPVDLHWQIRAAASFYRLPHRPLREQAVSRDYQGIPVQLLAPSHACLHLCLHTFGDFVDTGREAFNARQVIELALLLARLPPDWPHLLAEVARFHCQAPVYLVLKEMRALLPALIPPGVLTPLADYQPPLAERLLLSGRLGPFTNYLAIVCHYPGRDGLRYLAAKLWPEAHYLAVTFGLRSRAAYFRHFLSKFFPGA